MRRRSIAGQALGDGRARGSRRLASEVGHGHVDRLLDAVVADPVDDERPGVEADAGADARIVLDEAAIGGCDALLHRAGDVGLAERGRGGEVPERGQGHGGRCHQMSTTIRAAITAPRSNADERIVCGRGSGSPPVAGDPHEPALEHELRVALAEPDVDPAPDSGVHSSGGESAVPRRAS